MAQGSSSNNAAAVFGTAVALRLALFQFPALADLLGARVEISTPVTSFKRLSEGVFLFTNGVPPYDGGVVHQAPLLLGLFYPIITSPLLVNFFYILADLAIGYMLLHITAIKDKDYAKVKKIKQYGGKEEEPGMSGLSVATLYLFNPYTIASCIGRSTILYSNAAVVAAIWMGMKGNKSLAMFSVAAATYLSLYPAMLIIPVILMLTRNINDSELSKRVAVQCSGLFAGSLAALFVLSFVLVNSWDFFGGVYGTILTVSDLTPNLGLCWYFFIEMFDQFRPFFLVVFQIHVFIFAVPVSIKLRKYPLFVSFLLCAIMGTFKGYPSVGDASLYLGLLPLSSEIFKYMRYSFLITNLFLYSTLLAPIFWYLWVYVGSGNANFFYAIGLVYGIGEIILMIDSTFAVLRRDFEAQSPPETSGQDVALGWDREAMAPFDDALERMERLLRCPLCSDELHSTYTVKECGHHFCQKCIYPVLGTDCVCPTCSIPARVGNLVKNPNYDILVACVTKLRNIRLAQDSSEAQGAQAKPLQERDNDPDIGTFIGSPIWTYDCGPTFPNSDHFSDISTVEAPTFPSVDTAMTMHRKEIDLQAKSGADQETQQVEGKVRGQGYSSRDDGVTKTSTSQQTEILGDNSNNPTAAAPPPTISQLQRLLNIRKASSPTPQLRQESETPPESSSFYGDFRDTSHFSTPRMPTPSFQRSLLNLGSQYLSDTERIQENNEQQMTSDGPSRKRRMPMEEYTGRSGTPSDSSNGDGAKSRNKKPSRENVQRDDRYLSDTLVAMPEAQIQSDSIKSSRSRRQKESVEPGKSNFDGKRVWACTSCLKVMTIGRNSPIHECPACGQNQAKPRNGEAETSSSVMTTTDEEVGGDDGADGNGDYGQIVESSQPTLDANMFSSMPQFDLPLLPEEQPENRSVQHSPSISTRSTHSGKNEDHTSSNHISTVGHTTTTHSDQSASSEKIRSASEPATTISCVFTGLSTDQREKFDDNITRVIEAGLFMEHMPDQIFNESATHIITSIDPAVWKRLGVALCPRVLKYLVGMLSNGWIVRHEWFIDSIKSRVWLPLPNERYLVQGDAQFGPAPGTQRRRELRQRQSLKLFDSCRMFFYGEFGSAAQKSIKKQELLRLVQYGGSSVLMKRPPKSASSSRARSRTPGSGIRNTPEPNNSSNGHDSVDDTFFSPNRSFLYLTEDTKPWQVPIDKSAPIIVCDPAKIPSGLFVNPYTTATAATHTVPTSPSSQTSISSTTSMATTLSPADLKKHGWLRDFQAVSLTWVLNCISCSLMGKADVNMLYGTPDPVEIRELDQAWDSWRARKP
ncbi:hypothetical protein EC991_008712 [Linnemannia zychae]|nr:hypothetical protein EC991_008712 [Linnemannia zychae]